MKETAPACGMAFIRNLTDRPEFQWIAKTASVDFVAAGLAEGEDHAPGPQTVAVASMNTLSQSIAAKAGYTVLPIKSLNQAVPLLQSGRAGVLVAARQEVEKIAAASNVALPEEKVLAHGEAWMACNRFVERPDLERIAGAWNEMTASGELRDLYAKAGILGLYPEK